MECHKDNTKKNDSFHELHINKMSLYLHMRMLFPTLPPNPLSVPYSENNEKVTVKD